MTPFVPTVEARGARPGIMRIMRAVEWIVLLLAVGYFAGRGLPRAWGRLNTDFPNYYITARLLREGYSTTRVYEWAWLQRQKDHMGIRPIDQPVVGFIPHPPFSALLVWPLTFWSPLTAKRIWIVINLLLVVVLAVLLHSLTHLEWRRLSLIIALSYPLIRNFENGQLYLLLLVAVTFALWLYRKDRVFLAGAVMGFACAIKIFPGLFLLYFARKRDVRAVLGLIAGAAAFTSLAVLAFGIHLHSIYLRQVLPWAFRGDAMDPYSLVSNSLSSLLHKLLIFEPEWNLHPVVHAPLVLAIAQPVLQLLILAPAILLVQPRSRRPQQLSLEWASFLTALLAISTLPASYHFSLLILPVALVGAYLLRTDQYASLGLLALLYLAIGFPAWSHGTEDGWWTLLAVQRLHFVLIFCLLCYLVLRQESKGRWRFTLATWGWVGALSVMGIIGVMSGVRHAQGVKEVYGTRIPTSSEALLTTNPTATHGRLYFVAMQSAGYRVGIIDATGTHLGMGSADQLSQGAVGSDLWIEEARKTSRVVLAAAQTGGQLRKVEIEDAESPVASRDGKWLAYLRSVSGRNRIWVRSLQNPGILDSSLTPPDFDVEEMTYLSDDSLIFSAFKDGLGSSLYQVDRRGEPQLIDSGETRYPSASPDGRWLVYSRLDGGVWNLWLRDLETSSRHQLIEADCNITSSSWLDDSKTIVYASDCGRALGFSALYRWQVIP